MELRHAALAILAALVGLLTGLVLAIVLALIVLHPHGAIELAQGISNPGFPGFPRRRQKKGRARARRRHWNRGLRARLHRTGMRLGRYFRNSV